MTEKELITLQQANLFQSEKMIAEGYVTLDELSAEIPGWIHLNHPQQMHLTWMSRRMENDLQKDSKEVELLGTQFMAQIIHEDTTRLVLPHLLAFIARADDTEVTGFIQKIRHTPRTSYEFYYTTVKYSQNQNQFFCQSLSFKNLETSISCIPTLTSLNEMIIKYFREFELLTKREKEVLKLIAMGESNKRIGEMLHISALTVKTHRQNILRKLNVNRTSDLIKIALAFGLI